MDEWTARLSEPFRGRKIILTPRILASTTPLIEQLKVWGSCKPLVIATGDGTGALPGPADADIHRLVPRVHEDLTSDVRASIAMAVTPPPDVVEAVEAYDPMGESLWWAGPFNLNEPVLGRAVLGGRRREWAALEDKTVCDELWDAADVSRAPSVVVGVDRATEAARDVDLGDGTVWAGDARDGLNGGSDYVRWVMTPEQSAEAAEFFAPRCDRVRVMPFLGGTACSIHGFVLPDGTATFRPVELVQVPDADSGRFEYSGMSTWWDPPSDVREQMRGAARRVGGLLSERVGYRGGFSIDGVAGPDGFLPTELNPRFSGGLTTIARALPGLPITLLQDNAVMNRDVGISALELEWLVTSAADGARLGNVMAIRRGEVPSGTRELPIRFEGGRISVCDAADAHAMLSSGPHATGSFNRAFLDGRAIGVGESAAPHARALRAFVDRI